MKKSNTAHRVLDELLVIRAQNGDTEAFELLVKRWNKRLMHHAYRHIRELDPCADIVQDAWQDIIQGIKGVRDPSKFTVWALTIISRKAYRWIKRKQLDRSARTNSEEIRDIFYNSEENHEDEIGGLKGALSKLPPNHHLIISMFYSDGLTVNEISVILDIPKGTVKSRLYHAREQLKKYLKSYQS